MSSNPLEFGQLLAIFCAILA